MKKLLPTALMLFFSSAAIQTLFANGRFTAPPLTAAITKTNVSVCGNGHDGSIIAIPSGGTAPYTFSWSGPNGNIGGNSGSLLNLPIGFYNLTVTDASQITFTVTNIHVASAFAVYVTNSGATSSTCGSTGAIFLYGNAGVLPYTYSLNGTTYQASNTFMGLAAGSYIAYVKDAAGCVSTKNIEVASAPPIIVSPYVRHTKSCSNDGIIEIYRTGGIPPYSYSLDNVNYQATNKYTNLAGGIYTAWVKDSKGCTGSQQVLLQQAAPMVINAQIINSSTCADDGKINVVITGGDAGYAYSINGGPYQANSSFMNLTADTYEINVIDSKGCTASATVDILLNPINVSAIKTDASDCASNNGSIHIFATGGFEPYQYSVDNFNYQDSGSFSTISSGIYYCYVKDSRGCKAMVPGLAVGPFNCSPERTSQVNNKINSGTAASIAAYPNPSANEFILSLTGFSSNEKILITVTDLFGTMVYKKESYAKQQFTFGKTFKRGLYNVEVCQGADKKIIRLIKE